MPSYEEFNAKEFEFTLQLAEAMNLSDSKTLEEVVQHFSLNFTEMNTGMLAEKLGAGCYYYYIEDCIKDVKHIYQAYAVGNRPCFQFNSFQDNTPVKRPFNNKEFNGLNIYLDTKTEDSFGYIEISGAMVTIHEYGHPFNVKEGTNKIFIKFGEFSIVKLSIRKVSL